MTHTTVVALPPEELLAELSPEARLVMERPYRSNRRTLA